MSSDDSHRDTVSLLRDFDRVENESREPLGRGNLEDFAPFWEQLLKLRAMIMNQLADEEVTLLIDPDLRRIAQRIRNGETVLDILVGVFKKAGMVSVNEEMPSLEEMMNDRFVSSTEFDEVLQDEILGWVDPISLLRRKQQLGGMVVGKEVPESVQRRFQSIRHCYLFGIDDAAVVYARTLIEEALRKALETNNVSKISMRAMREQERKLEKVPLDPLIQVAKEHGIVSDTMEQKIRLVQQKGNDIVHGRQLSEQSHLEVIMKAMQIVEDLYKQTTH
jgi:hypothetical protein